MAVTTLETILQYIEGLASTNADLNGHIKVVRPKEPIPNIKDYGLKVYCGESDWSVSYADKIGPIRTTDYKINMDLVFSRNLEYRNVFNDAKGVSYWENLLTLMFGHGNMGGLCRDSHWSPVATMEENGQSVIIKGIFYARVDTPYVASNPTVDVVGKDVTFDLLPQDLRVTASPTFAGLNITNKNGYAKFVSGILTFVSSIPAGAVIQEFGDENVIVNDDTTVLLQVADLTDNRTVTLPNPDNMTNEVLIQFAGLGGHITTIVGTINGNTDYEADVDYSYTRLLPISGGFRIVG